MRAGRESASLRGDEPTATRRNRKSLPPSSLFLRPFSLTIRDQTCRRGRRTLAMIPLRSVPISILKRRRGTCPRGFRFIVRNRGMHKKEKKGKERSRCRWQAESRVVMNSEARNHTKGWNARMPRVPTVFLPSRCLAIVRLCQR